jgi:NADH:ubiquinone oxidoreductase subunit 5 (subunit L)/multisubunit Na+/H+ antiporter MnhA subunit
MKSKRTSDPRFKNLDVLAKLMDSQFRIPGTNIRFGLDALIGLVPGAGDFVSFLVSSYLVSNAINKGASGYVLSRMVLNIVVDALVGAIPVLGDIFDVAFKANQRNVKLLQQHYSEGRHQGSSKKVIIPIVIVMLGLFVGLIWLIYKLVVWIF